MSVLRTFVVPLWPRESLIEADVLTFYGTTASPSGIAILTLCAGEPTATPTPRLLGPDGQQQLGRSRTGTQRWRYVIGLEGEAPPASVAGAEIEMQPIGGVWAGMGGVWVFVERVA